MRRHIHNHLLLDANWEHNKSCKEGGHQFLIAFSELLRNQTKSHTPITANVSAELQAYFVLAISLKLTGSNNYLMSQASEEQHLTSWWAKCSFNCQHFII